MLLVEVFGALTVSLMVLFYALEGNGTMFVLCFALACLLSAMYAALIGAWPFAVMESIWAGVAARRWLAITRHKESSMTTATVGSACTLEGDRLEDRLTMIRRELLPRVKGTHELADGLIYEFDASPSMHTQLNEFVAFERTCCGSLQWNVRETSTKLHLHIDGIDPRALRAQIEGAAEPESGYAVGRVAKAAGIGFSGAFLVCCILPLGVALVLGAAVIAPFAFLDSPLWMGVGTLVFAVPAWFLLARKRRDSRKGCGC